MPNIVGEAFLPYVVDQINTRQKILGKPNRDSRDLAWEVGKTSWIRLASSINIASETVIAPDGKGGTIEVNNSGSEFRQKFIGLNGQNYGGNRLASELVLQGGALLDGAPRFGITQTNSILPSNPSSYGLGGTEFGIQPMPGITSFNVKSYNNGTLREATLSIQANNRKQFEYIDTLYLRLGYTMFVEWGNTSYPISISPNGEVTYATGADIDSLSLTDTFINVNSNKNEIPKFQNDIEKNREKSKGNYDGFVGIVKNFSWEFNKDGTYTINLILISAGSVIESLKLNNQVEGISYSTPSGSSPTDSTRASALATFIDLATNPIVNGVDNVALKQFLTPEQQNQLKLSNKWLVRSGVSGSYTYPILSCNAAFGGNGEDESSVHLKYVHFGSLLSFINKKLLTYDPDGESNFISIDYNEDTLVYSNGWSVSSDPKKLIVGFYQKIDNENCVMFKGVNTTISQFHSEIDGIKVGRLMNVYFEQQYLKSVIANNQDSEDGGVYLDKFLNTLLNDINVCLGNVNKLKYRVRQKKYYTDQTRQETKIRDVIQFYDEVSIYGKEKLTDGNYDYTLNLYGFHPMGSSVEGSFVIDYGLKTEISKRLQTQIAIGAQAGGQAVGFDSTAISKWNVGLVDRVNPVKIDINQINKGKDQAIKNYNDFIELSAKYVSYLKLLKGNTAQTFDTTTRAQDRATALQQLGDAITNASTVANTSTNLTPGGGIIDAAGNILNAGVNAFNAYIVDPVTGALGVDYQFAEYGKGFDDGIFSNIANATAYKFKKLNLNSTEGENQWAQFQSIQSTFFSKVLAGDALGKGISTPFVGFLPINFTVTLDGISGVRIFDKLQVDARFLPPNYGETLEFVITGLDHKIENNKWVTILETTSLPKISGEAQVILDLGAAIEETLTETEAQRSFTTGEKIADTARNRQVVEQIITLGKRFNYNDYQRQFALIVVALAESGLNPFADENFNYSLQSAKANFSKIRALSDSEALTYIPRAKGGSGSAEKFANFIYGGRYGNGANEGYKYRGSGLTQITFKSNYKKMDENLTKYGYPVSSFFPNNPGNTLEETPNLLRNGSAKAQELAVAILVVGKVAGQFGKKLSPSTDYINGGINNIIQTQNGGVTKSETSPSAINYGKKRNIVKNTEWVFELFKKYELLDNTHGTEKTPLTTR